MSSTHDFDAASLYVEALTGNRRAVVTLQSFDDCGKRGELAQIRGGQLADLWPWVLDVQGRGAGMFCAVNVTAPGKRTAADVSAVRAVFVDCDHRTEVGKPWHLEPSIVVASGRGLHAYWTIDPWPIADGAAFKRAQRMLSTYYNTDPAPCDLPRVMRLPGTLHQKGEPMLVQLVSVTGAVYHPDEVLAGIPELPRPVPVRRREIEVIGGAVDVRTVDIYSLALRAGLKPVHVKDGCWAIECPWRNNHTGGLQGPTAAVVFGGPGQHPGFKCQHASCSERTIYDVLRVVGVDVLSSNAQTRPTRRAAAATARAAARLEAMR